MSVAPRPAPRHGLLAEFDAAAPLIAAARALRDAGIIRLESYTPIPVPEIEALIADSRSHRRRSALPAAMFACGMAGFIGFFLLQCWGAIDYPINVGGRPLLSWPAFVPSAVEVAFFTAIAGGVVLFFAANRMPRLHHPLDEMPGFERASQDGFFLAVEADDPRFEPARVRGLLERCRPVSIQEVGIQEVGP